MVSTTRLPVAALFAIAMAPFTSHVAAAPTTEQNSNNSDVAEAERLNAEIADLFGAGRYSAATPLAERALAIRERALGRDHPDTLISVNDLALLYSLQNRYDEAEPLNRRALEASERVNGPDHPDTILSVSNLALLYSKQRRYAEAEPLHRRGVETSERVLGRDHPDTLIWVNNLAKHYHVQGRNAEAEPLYRRLLEASDRKLGHEHPNTLTFVGNLADLYVTQGLYGEAEPLYYRVLEASERVRGREHPDTLTAVNNLARLYSKQGRYEKAAPMYRRALETSERLLGRQHENTLTFVGNLAQVYSDQGSYPEAEALFRRALESSARVRGPEHPATLTALNNLALMYSKQRRYADAEPLQRRAFEIGERVLGSAHPDTLIWMNNLAQLYEDQGRFSEAERLYRRALEARERTIGREHPDTLLTAENLLTTIIASGSQAPDSMIIASRYIDAQRARQKAGGTSEHARAQRTRETRRAAGRFSLFADAGWQAVRTLPAQRGAVRNQAFVALQDAMIGVADESITAQAARRYAIVRSPQLAASVLERQKLQDQWTLLDDRLAQAFGAAPAGEGDRPAAIRREMASVQERIAAIDERLRRDAPEYFALIEPTPLDEVAAQHLVGSDEAILLIVPSRFGTHLMAVTREGIDWHRSDWDAERVAKAVRRLRWDVGARVTIPEEELNELQDRQGDDSPPTFDRTTAYRLYQEVVGPVHSRLAGKRKLFVAASGPLAGLPFSLLVSAPPPVGRDNDPVSLRATHWFADDFELTHIPSIQSLAILRGQRRAGGGHRFLGVGNPQLAAAKEERRLRRNNGAINVDMLFARGRLRNGTPAYLPALRQLPSLPGTALELEQVRDRLGASASSILQGASATEPAVRALDFTRTQLVLFSTHGLTSEEAIGAGEPGLVLTPPPPRGGVEDQHAATDPANDGYLAASEVTSLSMDAEWVVLSACNTATGDDNANLSALARAFFYAGARNLLASHWPVSDEVAPALITRTVAPERRGLSRGAALQAAMQSIRDEVSRPEWAHPFYWAPFVLIGDGAS